MEAKLPEPPTPGAKFWLKSEKIPRKPHVCMTCGELVPPNKQMCNGGYLAENPNVKFYFIMCDECYAIFMCLPKKLPPTEWVLWVKQLKQLFELVGLDPFEEYDRQ